MGAANIAPTPTAKPPSALLQLGSLVLPLIKCAACPACLSVLVPVLAGARVGLLLDERLHAALLLGALAADFVILGLAGSARS